MSRGRGFGFAALLSLLVLWGAPAFVSYSPRVVQAPVQRGLVASAVTIGDYEISPPQEEDTGAQAIAGTATFFLVGLIFPVIGGFTLGLLFAIGAFCSTAFNGRDLEVGETKVDLDSVADAIRGLGSVGVKAYNFGLEQADKRLNA
mmetsp:Transcript_3986/g.9265  ORF Transcript_3986/g.9265 Transcript_3986/m.9265 type:complete len:146 (-) Transcript_3986:143-580(-)